jgi:hypothetical protein
MSCGLGGDRQWHHNPEHHNPNYLLVFENRVLIIFELKREEATGE